MITFTVNTKPKGKERARHSKYTTYSTDEMVLYQNEIKIEARQAMIRRKAVKTKSPIHISIVAYFKPAKSWPSWKMDLYKDGLLGHTSTPDTDNICKAVFDAMNDTVYFDDKQIVNHACAKEWADENKITIYVSKIGYIPSSIKTKKELAEWKDS